MSSAFSLGVHGRRLVCGLVSHFVQWPKTTAPSGVLRPGSLPTPLCSSMSYDTSGNGTPIAITRFRSPGSADPVRCK